MKTELAPPELRLLLFRLAGTGFGLDAEQVTRMSPYAGAQGGAFFWLHQLLEFGAPPPVYSAPTVLTIAVAQRSFQLVIDAIGEIASFNLDQIRPLPKLIEPHVLPKGIWGVLQHGAEPVLLLDFQRLRQRIEPLSGHLP